MAYTALYREWRPKTFDELVGQKQVTVTLKNQVQHGRVAHAYLLCGTRGTGKTSTAKILAKSVNCLNSKDGEPCNECEMCKKIAHGISMDVTEMDAASHNGVDDIRAIIEEVQYPPQEAKFKVYIIDEVHMLSMGAVNAFLKTLEEPPKNVIFILATTDPQKLPITILSRCQRYDFKRIKNTDIQERLREIVSENAVFADDKSLSFIARMCDGAMRDALSILDQAIAMGDGKVVFDDVVAMLGVVTNENLLKLTDNIIQKDISKCIQVVDEIILSGKDISLFIKEMTTHMRNLMMVKVTDKPEEVLDMSEENIKLIQIQASKIRIEEIMRHINILQEAEEQSKYSKQSRVYLELAIIKMCKIEYDTSNEILLSRINKLENVIRNGGYSVSAAPQEEVKNQNTAGLAPEKVKTKQVVQEVKPVLGNQDCKITLEHVKKSWKDILDILKARRLMVLYAYLAPGKPVDCKSGVVEIRFSEQYAFSKQNLEKTDNNKKVEDIFTEVLKEKIRIKYSIERAEGEGGKSTEELLKETFGADMIEVIDE